MSRIQNYPPNRPDRLQILGYCYNGIIDKDQKEQNKLDFQVGNEQVLYTLCGAFVWF